MEKRRRLRSFEQLESRSLNALVEDYSTRIGGSGYEEGRGLVQTTTGGYAAAGWTSNFHGSNDEDVLVTNVDAQGRLQWSRTFGGPGYDRAYSIANLGTGYIVAGTTQSFGQIARGYIICLDADGNELWSRGYGDQASTGIRNIRPTADGNFIATGWTGDTKYDDSNNLFLLKIDPLGNVLWSQEYVESCWQVGHEVVQAADGGFVVSGLTASCGETNRSIDGRVLKTDALGNIEWEINNGGASWDEWHGLSAFADGFIVSGGRKVNGIMRTRMMEIDPLGNVVWDKTYTEFGYSWHVTPTPDGGFVATGNVTRRPTTSNRVGAFILKVDRDGNRQFGKTLGGPFADEGRYILSAGDGKYVILGYYGEEDGAQPSTNSQPDWNRNLWIYQVTFQQPRPVRQVSTLRAVHW